MRENNFPHPVTDTEAEGLPRTADDDSTAWDDVDSPRIADGPEPAMLPGERPQGIGRYGNTPEEARIGESLDSKMRRETPDPALNDPVPAPPPGPETFDAEPLDADTDVVDASLEADPEGWDRRSPVSMYDDDRAGDGLVGRLVEPDEGAHEDIEKDAIARDVGAAGGGPSAEELAMHEIPED